MVFCPSTVSFQNSPYLTAYSVQCWDNTQTAFYGADGHCSLRQLFPNGQSENSVSLKEARKIFCSRELERTDLGCNYHSSCFQTNKAYDDNWAMQGCLKGKDVCKGIKCSCNFETIGGMSDKITSSVSCLQYYACGFSVRLLLSYDSFLSMSD